MTKQYPMMSNSNPGFSVIIPAHKADATIGATLQSVVAQTHLPSEILIYEDGRTDDLPGIVDVFAATAPCPVRRFGCVINQGVSRARNALLQEACGEYVAFLDADDIWSTDHLARAAACFAESADVAFSGVTFIDADGNTLPGRAVPSIEDFKQMAASLYQYNFIQCTSTLSVRRSMLVEVGAFDTRLSHGEDLDLWLRLLAAGAKWRYTGHCTCAYRKHSSSAMGQTLLAVERLAAFYEKNLHNTFVPRRARRHALANNRWDHARLNWRQRPEESLAALRRLIRMQPWNPVPIFAWLAVSIWRQLSAKESRGRTAKPVGQNFYQPGARNNTELIRHVGKNLHSARQQTDGSSALEERDIETAVRMGRDPA